MTATLDAFVRNDKKIGIVYSMEKSMGASSSSPAACRISENAITFHLILPCRFAVQSLLRPSRRLLGREAEAAKNQDHVHFR